MQKSANRDSALMTRISAGVSHGYEGMPGTLSLKTCPELSLLPPVERERQSGYRCASAPLRPLKAGRHDSMSGQSGCWPKSRVHCGWQPGIRSAKFRCWARSRPVHRSGECPLEGTTEIKDLYNRTECAPFHFRADNCVSKLMALRVLALRPIGVVKCLARCGCGPGFARAKSKYKKPLGLRTSVLFAPSFAGTADIKSKCAMSGRGPEAGKRLPAVT